MKALWLITQLHTAKFSFHKTEKGKYYLFISQLPILMILAFELKKSELKKQ